MSGTLWVIYVGLWVEQDVLFLVLNPVFKFQLVPMITSPTEVIIKGFTDLMKPVSVYDMCAAGIIM